MVPRALLGSWTTAVSHPEDPTFVIHPTGLITCTTRSGCELACDADYHDDIAATLSNPRLTRHPPLHTISITKTLAYLRARAAFPLRVAWLADDTDPDRIDVMWRFGGSTASTALVRKFSTPNDKLQCHHQNMT